MQFRYNPRCFFTALQIVEDRKKAQAGKKFAKKAGFFSSCQDFGKGWTNASTISRFWMDSEAKTKKLEERAKALAILRADACGVCKQETKKHPFPLTQSRRSETP